MPSRIFGSASRVCGTLLKDFDRQYRVSLAAFALRIVEVDGTTLDDLTFGEAGSAWIRGWCGGDLEVALEAFELVHDGDRVLFFQDGDF